MDSFKHHKSTNDAVLIHTMFDIGRTLHNSLDSLSDDNEKRHISQLLCSFIQKIDFGKDLEQQLSIYVECRSIFSSLDAVQDLLILSVCNLTIKAFKFMKGKHNKKTSTFVKSCIAYCHITIPSISDVYRKMVLLLYCSQIALLNQLLPQTDTLLKLLINLMIEMNTEDTNNSNNNSNTTNINSTATIGSTTTTTTVAADKRSVSDEKLSIFLKSLLSTLVIVPGHPEHGPFYLIHGLLNALQKYSWQSSNLILYHRLHYDILSLLCTLQQRSLPYHIAHIESNDRLYSCNNEYLNELNQLINNIIENIIKFLSQFNEKNDLNSKMTQVKLILEFVDLITCRININNQIEVFIIKLLELIQRNKNILARVDIKYYVTVLKSMKRRMEAQSNGASIGTSGGLGSVIRELLLEYDK